MNQPAASKRADPPTDLRNHPALFEEQRQKWMERKSAPFLRRAYLMQLIIFAGVLAIWQIPIVNPVKLLVVLFHEFSHVIMGYATGAVIFGIAIDPGGAGITLGMGGNQLLVLMAGYLGSLAMGVVLYALCAVWAPIEVWLCLTVFCGLSMFTGWLNGFTKVFGWGTLILMAYGAVAFSSDLKLILLRIVGTASSLYPIIDVFGELWGIGRQGFNVRGRTIGSDVMVFGQMLGVPWWVVGLFWTLAGLVLLAWLVPWSAHKEALTEVRGQLIVRAKARERDKRFQRKYDPGDPTTIREYTIK